MNNIIKSTSFNDQEIINNILQLHCKGDSIDADVTYSIDSFYKNNIVKNPKIKIDLNPKENGVIKANAEKLPLYNNSINTIMFDPPFLAATGKSLKANRGNIINKRFGVYPNEKSLQDFYIKALNELYRVCKRNGILIFKCQDKISSGKQYFNHCFIYNEAIKVGWYAKDLFVKIVNNRLIADWQRKNQKHARKFHCYYWVFKK